jgi:hypothetical protein
MTSYRDEQIQACAVQFLLDGGERDAANLLLSCELTALWLGEVSVEDDWNSYHRTDNGYKIVLSSHYAAHTVLKNWENPLAQAIRAALESALLSYPASSSSQSPAPEDDPVIVKISIGARMVDTGETWKEELLEMARGKTVFNQGIAADSSKTMRTWNNLRFGSESEVRIAQALDRAKVLFFPNCRARLNTADGNGRENREPDFLVCFEGKWGIIEVDGAPFHPPSRTVHDHERDRLFKNYGIRTVEHFDSGQCLGDPDYVVRKFLALLKQS